MDEFLALGHGRAQVREDRLLGEELVQGLHIALWRDAGVYVAPDRPARNPPISESDGCPVHC
jgi:hypothetical protein